MREKDDAIVIEANFNEVNQSGVSGVGQEINETYPDHSVLFYSTVDDGVLFVLVPK